MKNFFAVVFFLACASIAAAQDSSMLTGLPDVAVPEKVTGAFKSTRVINSHSIEMLGKGGLDFRILHRFNPVNEGLGEFFGLDHAAMRIGFDYGLTDGLTLGVGRSTFRKELDGFLKTRFLQQTKGSQNIPVTVVGIAGITTWTEKTTGEKRTLSDRTAFFGQLLAGRKFTSKFSWQWSAVVLHMNYVATAALKNTVFAFGTGLRYKLGNRTALVADYHHVLNGLPDGTTDPLSIGFDIETGGHVFQLHFSNAVGMNERAFLAETTDRFFKGDIRFGFNLSRMFQPGRSKKKW